MAPVFEVNCVDLTRQDPFPGHPGALLPHPLLPGLLLLCGLSFTVFCSYGL